MSKNDPGYTGESNKMSELIGTNTAILWTQWPIVGSKESIGIGDLLSIPPEAAVQATRSSGKKGDSW